MILGGMILGGIGFMGGYCGPLVLAPEANQGPLLSLYTGPAGALVGVVAGWAYTDWKRRRR